MKQLLSLIFFVCCLCINAQKSITNHKDIYDKFDDVIQSKSIKTIVSKDDSTIVIEEKGSKPVIYRIINYADFNSKGSKDNIVNLVQDVYGYQDCWHVILNSDYKKYYDEYFNIIMENDENKRRTMISNMLDKYSYYFTHRVITSKYTHEFEHEYFWIQKGDDNGRTIYYDK